MNAIISNGDYTASVQLPIGRKQLAGALSYLCKDHASAYDIKYNEESNQGLSFTPIGNNGRNYTGTFNGNGKTVSGLYINDSSKDYQSLFGYIGTGGKVENLGIVTIPEKAQVNGEAVSVSAEAGALRHDQTVMVRIDDNAVFTLYPDGDTTKTGVDYAVYAADSEASLAAGGIVLESGNTESGAPATVSLTFKTAEEPKYAGKYTDTVTFNISTGTTAGVVVDPGWDEEITVGF